MQVPITVKPLTEQPLIRHKGPLIEFALKIIPAMAVVMHKRVIEGHADEYFGHTTRVVHIHPSQEDRDRWPHHLKNAKNLIMVYGTRRFAAGRRPSNGHTD